MNPFLLINSDTDDGFDVGEVGSEEAGEKLAATAPLRPLPPGPWRSSGGFLNYEEWPDRERFLELDRVIRSTPVVRPAALSNSLKAADRRSGVRMAAGENCNWAF